MAIGLSSISNIIPQAATENLREIDILDKQLYNHFKTKFLVQSSLTRLLVSFQANKTKPIYRWYQYKEAFSASLVELLFQKYKISQGKILDP